MIADSKFAQTNQAPDLVERMFIFHWQADGDLTVLYCGPAARVLLGIDKGMQPGSTQDDYPEATIYAHLESELFKNGYREGQHRLTLKTPDPVYLDFLAADAGADGIFWHGHVMKQDEVPQDDHQDDLLCSTLVNWLNWTSNPWTITCLKDLKGRYLYTNDAFNEFSGKTSEDFLGKTVFELFDEERASNISHADNAALDSEKRTQSTESTVKPLTNERVTIEVIRQPVRGPDGEIFGLYCIGRELGTNKDNERGSARRFDHMATILDSLSLKVSYYAPNGDLIYMNKRAKAPTNARPDQFDRINIFKNAIFDENGGEFRRHFTTVSETRREMHVQMELMNGAGVTSLEDVSFIPDIKPNGVLQGVIVLGLTAETEQLRNRTETRGDNFQSLTLQMQTLLNTTEDAIWIKDEQGRFLAFNEAFQSLTGAFAFDIMGKRALTDASDLPPEISAPSKLEELAAGRIVKVEDVARAAKGGSERHLSIAIHPIPGENGTTKGSIGIARDITEIKALKLERDSARHKLSELVNNDPLTGLPNERHARERIAGLLHARGDGSPADAIFLLDLNRFGEVNDSIGYAAGDQLMIRVAARIRQIANIDYCARFSGDGFLVHARIASQQDAEAMAMHLLDVIAKPYFNEGRYLTLNASVGVTLLPGTAQNADDAVTQVGLALREAKKSRASKFHVFDPGLMQVARDRFSLEADIRAGLENGQFETHYQPKIDLRSNTVTGAEALMRWRHPRRGNIPPAMFIPLAEETGLILPLGEKILFDACVFAKEWNAQSGTPMKVAVNLSPLQLMADDFISLIRRTLAETGCLAEWLELEITESLILSDHLKVGALLDALARLGVSIAIDDFGTGYSAMSYLISYPISTLKIDRSFVRDVISDKKKAVLVKAIIDMANGLNMNTVAEGIETSAEAQWVRDTGCREGQGFLWCRAISRQSFVEWAKIFREDDGTIR